jgi:biopolymer transport protein ExbB/TolQ
MGHALDTIKEFFETGGPFMFVNLIFSAIAIAIIIERTIALFKASVNGGPFMAQLVKQVREGHVDRAMKLCAAAPHAAMARVLQAGLSRANRGEQEVAAALEEAILEQTPLLQKRIASLWSVANIATLTGLIGTISGLIGSFKALGKASPSQKAELLSKGISEAMNNTAFGLSIAVICIIGHLLLTNRSKAMIEEMELNAMRLENLLAQRASGEPNPTE